MSLSDRERWDAKYAVKSVPEVVTPDEWLVKHVPLRTPGQALELACGLGHNAIWLAQKGWQVEAVDISPTGLALAQELEQRVAYQTVHQAVSWIAADLDEFAAHNDAYDLIVVFRFLDRVRIPALIERILRPGGLLVYETFSRSQMTRTDNHLRCVDFTLAPDELSALFPRLEVIESEEVDLPDRCVARLVAQKSHRP